MKRMFFFLLATILFFSCHVSRHLKPQYTHLLKVPVTESQHIISETQTAPAISTIEHIIPQIQEEAHKVQFDDAGKDTIHNQSSVFTVKKQPHSISKITFEAGRSDLKAAKRTLLKNVLSDDNISREDIIFWLVVIILVAVILSLLRIDIVGVLTAILLILLIILVLQLLGIHILAS